MGPLQSAAPRTKHKMCSVALKTNIPDDKQPHHHCHFCHSHTIPDGRKPSVQMRPRMPTSTPDARHSPPTSWHVTLMLASLSFSPYARRARSASATSPLTYKPFLAPSCLHRQMWGRLLPLPASGSGKALDQLFPCVIWRVLPCQALSTGATGLAPPLWGL